MLSDLLTSSRGPGVIGTVFALIILLGFGGLFIMVSDESGSFGGENLHTQMKSKEGSIRVKKEEVLHWQQAAIDYAVRRKQRGELQDVQRSVTRKLAQIEDGKSAVEKEREEIVALVHEFEDYKKKYRVAERERATGEEMTSLTTKDGKSFEKVSIRKISALGMEIRHKNGFKRIHYQNLPDEMQDRFQFIEEDAQDLTSIEHAAVKRSEKGKQNYDKSVKEIRTREKLREYRENRARWSATIAQNESKILSNTSAIKSSETRAQHYRSLGNRGLNYDKAKKEDGKADRIRRASDRLRTQISDLQRKMNQPAPQ